MGANNRMRFQLVRRLQGNGKLTLKDRRVRAILVADKGVSGWLCEGKKAGRGSKGRQLAEGLGVPGRLE